VADIAREASNARDKVTEAKKVIVRVWGEEFVQRNLQHLNTKWAMENIRACVLQHPDVNKAADHLNTALIERLTTGGRGKSRDNTLQPGDFAKAKTIIPLKVDQLPKEILEKHQIGLNQDGFLVPWEYALLITDRAQTVIETIEQGIAAAIQAVQEIEKHSRSRSASISHVPQSPSRIIQTPPKQPSGSPSVLQSRILPIRGSPSTPPAVVRSPKTPTPPRSSQGHVHSRCLEERAKRAEDGLSEIAGVVGKSTIKPRDEALGPRNNTNLLRTVPHLEQDHELRYLRSAIFPFFWLLISHTSIYCLVAALFTVTLEYTFNACEEHP
jgi:hypothetical protein